MMSLARMFVLPLLALVPIVLWTYHRRRNRSTASIRFSDLSPLRSLAQRYRPTWRHILIVFRCLSITLLIFALAGPRFHRRYEEIITHGVDIMLAIDCSGSMQAADFKPNRLAVAKEVLSEFIAGRKHDRMGLVVFAGVAFTQCPLTLDYGILEQFVKRLAIGTVETDGTAIGPAIASALNRMRDSKAKSRVIVLLTDGAENVRDLKVNYKQAAVLAQALGVKIYTVGVGREDEVPMEINHPIFGKQYQYFRAELNEEGLREIADLTGGQYFRASDQEALEEIFKRIDKLEKSEIKVKHYTRFEDFYTWLAAAALLFLLMEIVLAHTRFRTLP